MSVVWVSMTFRNWLIAPEELKTSALLGVICVDTIWISVFVWV